MPEENTSSTRITRSSQRRSQRLSQKDMAINDRKVHEKEASPSGSSSSSSESSSSSSSSESSSSSHSSSPSPAKGTFKKRRLRKPSTPRTKEPKKVTKNSIPPQEEEDLPEKPSLEDAEEPKAEESMEVDKDVEEKVTNDLKEEGEMSDEKEDSVDQSKGDASPPQSNQVHNKDEKSDTEMKTDNDTSTVNDTEAQDSAKKKAEASKPSFRLTKRRISLPVNKEKEGEHSESQEQQQQRRRRWGSSSKMTNATSLSISTDALKDLIPDYKPPVTNPLLEDLSQDPLEFHSDREDTAVPEKKEEPKKKIVHITKPPEPEKLPAETPNEEDAKMQSPPRNPPSCIVYIRNLVRPFTVQQLKNLLAQTGTVVESGFWIDKIKSKCYVTYETEDQAVATRAALHHARWPASNPKTLIVDFATVDELEFHQKLGDKPVIKPEPPTKFPAQQIDFPERREVRRTELVEDLRRREERDERRRERERKRERNRDVEHPPPPPPIREWDRDKISQDDQEYKENRSSRTKEKSSDRKERKDKKESKKKQEDDTPAKLLDDLFRKTKTTPCIYWLPLTEEQIRKLAEERKQRELEREKRRKQHQLQLEQAQKEREERREKERKSRGGREKESGRRSRTRSRSPAGRRR